MENLMNIKEVPNESARCGSVRCGSVRCDSVRYGKDRKEFFKLMKIEEVLNEGDVFKLQEGDSIMLSGAGGPTIVDDKIAGNYVVIETNIPIHLRNYSNYYPPEHLVLCKKIVGKELSDRTIQFWQTGPFSFIEFNQAIKSIGKMQKHTYWE